MRQLLTISIYFSILFASPLIASEDEEYGFNQLCQIYTEALSTNMSKEELGRYISENVDQRVTAGDAFNIHDAVFQVEPGRRYKVFKEAAEASLGHEWDCSAVKKLME